MLINTSRFGEINISEEKKIFIKDGIPGFENCKYWALITTDETDPFHWLQAIESPEIALAVINPFRLFPDYAPIVAESHIEDIGNPPDEDILILTVAVVPKDVMKMTTNLVSPILINSRDNRGKQIIMENSEYQIRQPIYDLVQKLVIGGDAGAGSDAQA